MIRNIKKTVQIHTYDEPSATGMTYTKEDETDLYLKAVLKTPEGHTVTIKPKHPVMLSEIGQMIDQAKKMVNLETLE